MKRRKNSKRLKKVTAVTVPPVALAPVLPVEFAPEEQQQPFSFKVTVREYTRLRIGDVVRHDGQEQVVISVNPSCARIIPITAGNTRPVEFTPRFSDKPVRFNAPVKLDPTAISANSESEILYRLGKNWKERLTTRRK
jgi:hypothetical protein